MDAVHERLIVRAKGALSLGIRQAELVELLWNLSTLLRCNAEAQKEYWNGAPAR